MAVQDNRGVRRLSLADLDALGWARYPLRTCRSLHHCEICDRDIRAGEKYFDGGYSRRAHDNCAAGLRTLEKRVQE